MSFLTSAKGALTPKRLAGAAAAAVVVVGAVAAAWARSSDEPSYRTAVVSEQSVDQVLHAVAAIEPVSQASVAFPVAGTVEGVDVAVGDTVTVGERLATLDAADLTVTLHEKEAALDRAELTLELALAGEDVGSVSGGGAPSGGFGRPAGSGSSAALEAAQQAVLDAQHAVGESTAASQVAFDNATAVCAGDDTVACTAALQAVLDAQARVSADQLALTEAADALTSLLADLAEEPEPEAPTTTTPSAPEPSVPQQSIPEQSVPQQSSPQGDGQATASSPSAEDLIAYQKRVDAAADEVAVAQQAIDQATIVSPIDGTVASVGLVVGDDVEAASATATVVVVGAGGFEVTTSISVKDLPDVEVGQAASVLPDGDDQPIDGEVVRIGVAADTSGSTATYPVTIALTGDTSAMGNGSTASVTIVTAAASKALAVPTSAVTVTGGTATLDVLVDDRVEAITVETGAIGRTWTEITTGIEEGDTVVLADLDEPLPGSATDGAATGTGGQQGFTGGPITLTGGPPTGFRPGG